MKENKNVYKKVFYGARGETRTLTSFRMADFESAASTIPPLGHKFLFIIENL